MELYKCLACMCLGVVFVYGSISYEGYKVYEIVPKTSADLLLLNKYEHNSNYDFWMHSKRLNSPANVMVSPQAQEDLEKDLTKNGVEYNVLISNVQDTINEEDFRQRVSAIKTRSENLGDVTFTHYMQYPEILLYLKKLGENYPNVVNLVDFGTSYEGREMILVQISADNFTSDKPLILIDAGIHAREWIAPPTALYVIQQLVENPNNSALYQNVDWAILPVLNPDGYAFTQTGDRMWRKTRTPPNATTCWGVDGNRNFDFQWMTGGASANECDETYAGHVPMSEVESQHLRDYMLAYQSRIKLYLSVHSYGNWLLYPWGYTTSEVPTNAEELHALAALVNDRISAVNGTQYVYGPSASTLYINSGSSVDYAKGAIGIELAYTIEMPAGGSVGFNPSADRIIPIVAEFFEGFKAYHEYIEEKFVTNATSPIALNNHRDIVAKN